MTHLFVLADLGASAWGQALESLREALTQKEREPVLAAYALLVRALSERGAPDLKTALAEDLLWTESPLSRALQHLEVQHLEVPSGLRAAVQQDLDTLLTLTSRDWQAEASRAVGRPLPPLKALAPPSAHEQVAELLSLGAADAAWLLERLVDTYRRHGAGPLARFEAFRWTPAGLVGIAHPVTTHMDRLVGLERQVTRLHANTLAFLSGKPAQHTLLYGPRGSGKSTAVRGLLKHYVAAGLRLVELGPADVNILPELVEQLRFRPHHYLVFVDDLSFEAGDTGYQPLKTLLEGSLTERPHNVLLVATSNRRHLVREGFKDRPDPLDDDVHAWDTQNERLALADRFGLTITFPDATQQRYLDIVRGLAEQGGVTAADLEERALRFAEWGNGYSGRTAQQFLDALRAEV